MTHSRAAEHNLPDTPSASPPQSDASGCCGGKGGGGCGGGGSCGGGHAHHHHHHDDAHGHHHEHDHDHDHDHEEHGCSSGGSCGCHTEGSGSHVYVFSRANIRELDKRAVSTYFMPSILLMENAARGVTGAILDGLGGNTAADVLILAGPGNNGGDGLAVARHLHNAGVSVAIVCVTAPSMTQDTKINLAIVRAMGLPRFETGASPAKAFADAMAELGGSPEVIVDALLGTGVDRPVTGEFAELIGLTEKARTAGATVVAIDLPSGLDADTGSPAAAPGQPSQTPTPGACVKADLTVTLAGLKAGFLNQSARAYVGDLVVAEIGVPIELVQELGEPVEL